MKLSLLIPLLLLLVACGEDEVSEMDTDLRATIGHQETVIAAQNLEEPVQSAAEPTQEALGSEFSSPTPEASPSPEAEAEADEAVVARSTPTHEVSPGSIPTLLWSAETESYVIRDGRAFMLMPDGSVEARELRTGRILWENENGGTVIGVDSRRVYVAPTERRIDALDVNTGEFRWRSLLETSLEPEFIRLVDTGSAERIRFFLWLPRDPNLILDINSMNGEIIGAIPRRGDLTWAGDRGLSFVAEGVLIEDDWRSGTSLGSGRSLWSIPNIGEFPLVCDSDTLVYTTVNDRNTEAQLAALKIGTSDRTWTLPLRARHTQCDERRTLPLALREADVAQEGGSLWLPPGGAASKSLYLIADEPTQLMSLDMESGEVLWSIEGPFEVRGTEDEAALLLWLSFQGEYGSKVIFSSVSYGLTRAYTPSDHGLAWENAYVALSYVVGATDDVLIGRAASDPSQDPSVPHPRVLVGLDLETGNERWRRELGELRMKYDARLVDEYLVYKPRDASMFLFLDPDTGDTVTSVPTPGAAFKWGGIVELDDLFVAVSDEALMVITW